MSRIDSTSIANEKAKNSAILANLKKPMTAQSVVASDAFFPFADGLIAAADAGVTAIIQPGGSIRDREVIAAADQRNIAMVFTNVMNPRSHVNRRGEYQTTLVKKGATIGANATIRCGVEIGQYAFIGAGAVVLNSITDYALVVGNPAQQIGWMSEAGARLTFTNERAQCPISQEWYQLKNEQVCKCM